MSTSPPSPAGVPSPCIDVCRMDDASGLCTGCHRTLDEIAAWSTLGDDAKRAVLALTAQRTEALFARNPSRRPP